jgi:26S proteasome regulatory subunit N12
VFIKVPVRLETYFVQGSYQKILSQQQNVPVPVYNVFVEKFVDAIRYEIARSSECSYDSLSLADAMTIFMIDSRDKLAEFIQQNQQKATRAQWKVEGDRLHFLRDRRETVEIPNHKMINLSLQYATELNRII